MSDNATKRQSRRPRRWPVMIVAMLVAIGLVASGWFVATQFTSPQQRAAAATAPNEKPITAQVQTGDLVDTRTLSGTISPTSSTTATLTAPAGSTRSVLTTVNAAAGSSVTVGTVVATVNGRPVFALQSPFPLYRDLGVGDTGPDVQSLQQNLEAMGLLRSADGEFGSQTAAAVSRLFDKVGYSPPKRADTATATSDPTSASGFTSTSAGASATSSPSTSPSGAPSSTSVSPTTSTPAQVVYFPMASAMTVTSLPAVVATTPQVGAIVDSSTVFGFTGTTYVVDATTPASLPNGLPTGTKVTVTGAGLNDAAGIVSGMVTATSTASSQSDSSNSASAGTGTSSSGNIGGSPAASSGTTQADIRINLVDTSLLKGQMSGQSVTVSATVKTVATSALIVPTVGVAEQDPTHGVVLLVSKTGTATRVPVTIIGTVGGTTALQPGGRLKAGDQVRVG